MIIKEKGLWALTLFGLAFFWRPLLLGETFFFRDIYLYYVPIKQILLEALRSGELPLWNVYLHGGQPLLADISATPFYPSVVLYLLFSVERALTLDIVIHVLASAAALYALARRLGLGQPSAMLAGTVYGYCGYTLSQANLYFRLLATPYLPLMLLCWHAYLRRPRRRALACLIALGTLQVFAGSAEMVAFTWLTLLGWALFQSSSWSNGRRLRSWLLLGAASALLAAPQLVPVIEMVGQSQRGEGMSAASFSYWSVDPRRLPELAVPGFMGRTDTFTPEDYWGGRIVDSGFPYMLSLYLGTVVLALALLGAVPRSEGTLPRGIRRLLLLLSLLALLLALGRFLPFFDLFYRIPGASLFRFPVKFLTLGVLPVALLAGEGAERLFRAEGEERKRLLAVAWAVCGATWLLLAVWMFVPAFVEQVQIFFFGRAGADVESGLRHGWLRLIAVWTAATLAVQLHAVKPRAWLPWALAALVAVDLAQAGGQVNPTVPADLLSKRPPVADLVAEHLGDGRFYRHPVSDDLLLSAPSSEIQWLYRWNQEVLRFYLAASYRIPVIFHLDFHGLAASRVMRIEEALESAPWDRRLQLLSAGAVTVFVTEDDVDLPGVERIGTIQSSSQPFHVYRNQRAAGRAQLVRAYRNVGTESEACDAMLAAGFDPRQHAVVEGDVPDADLACRGPGRAQVVEAKSSWRRISVNSECPGLLVLSEVHYPGWRARVDGVDVPLLRANAAFSAVWLEAGEHDVEWRYVPRAFYLGLLIAGVTAGGLIWLGRRAAVARTISA
ncbi:MAG: YfhO family protein [bacterium]|nr:YfhO family protein [bacterium]